MPLKMLVALPFLALIAACVPAGNDQVNTLSEIEATTDQDIDNDGTVPQGGAPVAAAGS